MYMSHCRCTNDFQFSTGSRTFWKVGHPNVSNNIVQMRSNEYQTPFYGGAQGQIPYNLGIKNKNIPGIFTPLETYSMTEQIYNSVRGSKRGHRPL